MDISPLVTSLLPVLGSTSSADLAEWCTLDELYAFADEAARRIAHRCGLFVDWVQQAAASGVSTYALPTGHLDTMYVAVGNLALRSVTVRELLAMDRYWQNGAGKPVKRYSLDAAGTTNLVLYGTPASTLSLFIVFQRFQPALSQSQTAIPVPSPVADYLTYAMLGEARRKESESSMPEIAAHADERLKLYEQIFAHYWGQGQGG